MKLVSFDAICKVFDDYGSLLLKGAFTTISISFISFFIGCIGGHLLGFFNSKHYRIPVVAQIFDVFVLIIRGTPLTIQVLLAFFVLSSLTNLDLPPAVIGIIALGINSIVYVGEIVRGSVNAIAEGQWEIAKVLGYGSFKTFLYVIFPQSIRQIVPSLINEYVMLIKETSILMIIGVGELSKVSKEIVGKKLSFDAYVIVAIIYLMITTLITIVGKKVEKGYKKWS